MINIKYNKGFTLIELIVSLAITSVLMLAFFTIVNSSIRSNSKNESDIKSLHVAQSEIENLRQQIKSGNDGKINIKVNGKTIEFINNIGNVDGKQDILYKRDVGDKTYLIKLNISREDINKYDGYLYDIDIKSELYNKKKDDVEKYVSKKETGLTTKILSNNQIDVGDIITPEYNNGSLFIRLRNQNLIAGNYLETHKPNYKYYLSDQINTLKWNMPDESNILLTVQNISDKINISGSVNGNTIEAVWGDKKSYYSPYSILIDPVNHDGGLNYIQINNLKIIGYDLNGMKIYEESINSVEYDDEPKELVLNDSNISKIVLECKVKFNNPNSTAHIVFGKEIE